MEIGSRNAVLVQLVKELNDSGSWSGETHIQKAVFFLQELMGVTLSFRYTLHKYGPFSFDLRDQLTAMRADRLIRLASRLLPYGPSFAPDVGAEYMERRFSKTLNRHGAAIHAVAKRLGNQDVAGLERLATALWVSKRECAGGSVGERASCLKRLKPHVPEPEALEAVEEVNRWVSEVS